MNKWAPVARCRICKCTSERGCPAGCAWSDKEDLCTVCAQFILKLAVYYEHCLYVSPSTLRRALIEAIAVNTKASKKKRKGAKA